jgi:anti-anti-sigma factor
VIQPSGNAVLLDKNDACGVILLRGEIDMGCVDTVVDTAASALSSPAVRWLVLDLAEVTFIDSSGIGALVKIRQMVTDSGRSVILRDPSRQAAAVLELTSVARLFK